MDHLPLQLREWLGEGGPVQSHQLLQFPLLMLLLLLQMFVQMVMVVTVLLAAFHRLAVALLLPQHAEAGKQAVLQQHWLMHSLCLHQHHRYQPHAPPPHLPSQQLTHLDVPDAWTAWLGAFVPCTPQASRMGATRRWQGP